jgi:hypothetical protein
MGAEPDEGETAMTTNRGRTDLAANQARVTLDVEAWNQPTWARRDVNTMTRPAGSWPRCLCG